MYKNPYDIHKYNNFLKSLDNFETHKKKEIQSTTLENATLEDIIKYNEEIFKQYENSFPFINTNTNTNTIINTNIKFVKREMVIIEESVMNLDDLIRLIDKYPYDSTKDYNINLKALHKVKNELIELNSMIGLKTLKENIVDQILYYIQNLKDNDYMHTVLYGPPGTGKTEVAKIIGKIFANIGILSKGTFTKVTRPDLIAGYLGQTALKTKDVVKSALGGVLFIDEAYSLGNEEKRDSFSKECIDTLCECASDHRDNLMIILAGYENELNECFFAYNQGLNSRFTWRFKTDDYTVAELYQIFLKKVNNSNWMLDEKTIDEKWFEKHKDYFTYYGRDMESLFSKVKIAHSKRIFCKMNEIKKKITAVDMENGLKLFLNNEDVKKRKDKKEINKILSSLYI
jgi:SpoVK/Ycf46/Vps4 family AAA+-type ATPase